MQVSVVDLLRLFPFIKIPETETSGEVTADTQALEENSQNVDLLRASALENTSIQDILFSEDTDDQGQVRKGSAREGKLSYQQVSSALACLANYLTERRQRWLKRSAKQMLSPTARGPLVDRFSILDTALVHCFVVNAAEKVFNFITAKNFADKTIVERLLLDCRPPTRQSIAGGSRLARQLGGVKSSFSRMIDRSSAVSATAKGRWMAMWPALYQLYKGEKRHREALSLFVSEVEATWSLKRGRSESGDLASYSDEERTSSAAFQPLADITNYLRNLSRDRATHGLVLEFAKPILDAVKADTKQALKVFNSPQNSMDLETIMDYLHRNMYYLCEAYLEHISGFAVVLAQREVHHNTRIEAAGGLSDAPSPFDSLAAPLSSAVQARLSKNSEVFERLAELYLETSRRGGVATVGPDDGSVIKAGDKVRARRKLQILLASPVPYRPAKVLSLLPLDDFFEERATLCSKLGQHEKALAILVHVMQNPKKAEEYCEKHYREGETGRDVYVALMKALMSDERTIAGYRTQKRDERSPADSLLKTPGRRTGSAGDIPPSVASLLERYYNRMDPIKVLGIVPASALLSSPVLLRYLQNTLRKCDHEKKSLQVSTALSCWFACDRSCTDVLPIGIKASAKSAAYPSLDDGYEETQRIVSGRGRHSVLAVQESDGYRRHRKGC